MKPRLLTILSALSLLLCIAVSIFWLRSRRTHDLVLFPVGGRVWQVSSLHGTLCLAIHPSTFKAPGSRFAHYPVSLESGSEPRAALDRLRAARIDMFAAEDSLDALTGRVRAGDPFDFRPRIKAARDLVLNARETKREAFARWQAADAVAKARIKLGFYWQHRDPNGSPVLALPYWSLFLLATALPVAPLLRRRRRRRARHGLCPNCHYDLRATPDRCPECGHQMRLTPH